MEQVPPIAHTVSGGTWNILSPNAKDVSWKDIAEGLAKICRFNGQTHLFYSVAQHCCLVADILPAEQRIYGLLHDAHEAFIGDITSPLKSAFNILGASEAISRLTEVTDNAIYDAANIRTPLDKQVISTVKHADRVVLATEKRDILTESSCVWNKLPSPLKITIKPWNWSKAMEEWHDRFETYTQK